MIGKATTPFLVVALVWLAFGVITSYFLTQTNAHPWVSVRWMILLWGLVVADLAALAGVMSGMFDQKASFEKNQVFLIIRTSSWGVIKLACLGLLGLVLYSVKEIPTVALLIGLLTMLVIPVGGGLVAKTD